MKLYVVRHGQTDWNVLKKVQGKADISLNEKGKEQAVITKSKLGREHIDLIICSPLKRTKETAKIINKDRNIPIVFDDRISERDFGEFEGILNTDFDFNEFWSYKKNIKYDRAENIVDFFNRIYSFLDELKEKYFDKNVLIVSHGGVSIPIECYFNGIPDKYTLLELCLNNCEIKKYTF